MRLDDAGVETDYDISGGWSDENNSFPINCKVNTKHKFSILQCPLCWRRSTEDNACWLAEYDTELSRRGEGPSRETLANLEPHGWYGSRRTKLKSQGWQQREKYGSTEVMMIGVLMGVLCALVTYMDYVAAFLPDDQPQREACDIKRILKEMVTSTVCPCVYVPPRKKKKRKRKNKAKVESGQGGADSYSDSDSDSDSDSESDDNDELEHHREEAARIEAVYEIEHEEHKKNMERRASQSHDKVMERLSRRKGQHEEGVGTKADKLKATTSTVKVFPVATKAANVSAKELAENMKNEMIEEVKNEVKAQAQKLPMKPRLH